MLKVPRFRTLAFKTQSIDRNRRRDSSIEKSLVERYLTGVNVFRVEDIIRAL